jgi:pyrroline-5-carboxylate reductase
MILDDIAQRGLGIIGCGKMGSALLAGWLKAGVTAASVYVIDPNPSDWLKAQGVQLNVGLPDNPAVVLVAVKPQMMMGVLGVTISDEVSDTIYVSVAAGTPISLFEQHLGTSARIVRTMPNTPAAIGRGITAIVGNARATSADLDAVALLMESVGQVVRLQNEDQMHAVTALSGSGPAYVFHLIETLATAGEAEGLPSDLAMALAKATVGGAGQLAEDAVEGPDQLRINVTSPNGTTQAALEVLMDTDLGFPALLRGAVKAAADRSKDLGS